MYNQKDLNSVKEILDGDKSSKKNISYNEFSILSSLGYHPVINGKRIIKHYDYKKNLYLYKCNSDYKPLNINNFTYISDYKKYQSFISCEMKNKEYLKEVDINTKNHENDVNTFKNIDIMFDKCYKEFNINKVCNDCEIYKIPNDTIFSNKIKKYIEDKSKDLDVKINDKIKKQYQVKRENYLMSSLDKTYYLKYKIDPESI